MSQAKTLLATRPDAKISTEEFAALVRVKPQSIRSALCRTGHYLGIKPTKLVTGRLLWDFASAERIVNGEVAK